MKIIELNISNYAFDNQDNPYAFDATDQKQVTPIARDIERVLHDNFAGRNVLIRGIQSGHHADLSKRQLVEIIIKNGHDIYETDTGEQSIIHAAPYSSGIVTEILKGFHVYKPKCEERPQYPADIWMIFDEDAYDNIEYIHPRHNVPVRDRWRLKANRRGLLGIIVIGTI